MLKNWSDIQNLFYLITLPFLVVCLWFADWSSWIDYFLYCCVFFLSVCISAVHHNHAHLPMWKNKTLNRLCNWWLSLLQGHPTFVFYASHNANHHRFHHGSLDVSRTYRFGGDANHLWGYICHPLHAVLVLYPLFYQWLKRIKQHSPNVFYYFIMHYACILILWISLAALHLPSFLCIVLLPQLFGLHWLLATNYLQHAHADGNSSINFARNFTGGVNFFCLNIGFHTAHHLYPHTHWSQLPALHAQLQSDIHPQLDAGSLSSYMLRSYVLSLFIPRYRSHSLMKIMKNSPLHAIHSKENLCP